MASYGERIRAARESREMSIQELTEKVSKRLGRQVSNDALYSYERNVRKPPANVLVAIADVLGVSMDYLAGRIDKPYMESADSGDGDLEEIVAAMFRAQKELPPEERKRLASVIRAGWPELFRERNE